MSWSLPVVTVTKTSSSALVCALTANVVCGVVCGVGACGGDRVPGQIDAATSPSVDAVATDGPPACVYPDGPYGIETNDILDPSLAWEGYAEDTSSPGTRVVAELFDCDGSKGINAILFSTALPNSSPDAQQAQDISDKQGDWGLLGIRVWFLLIRDPSGGEPTLSGVLNWRTMYQLGSLGVFRDPTFQLVSGSTVGTPQSTLVDPRTMRVVSVEEGYGGDLTAVENLATLNRGN